MNNGPLWAIDGPVPGPENHGDKDAAFLMPVSDVLQEVRIVVVGRIVRGAIKLKDVAEFVGSRPTGSSWCSGIEVAGNAVRQATVGEEARVRLHTASAGEIEPGMVIAAPGSIKAYAEFEANIYLLTAEQGGGSTGVDVIYYSNFVFNGFGTDGWFPETSVQPGDNIDNVSVQLSRPIALEVGMGFTLRAQNTVVGQGRVTSILN